MLRILGKWCLTVLGIVVLTGFIGACSSGIPAESSDRHADVVIAPTLPSTPLDQVTLELNPTETQQAESANDAAAVSSSGPQALTGTAETTHMLEPTDTVASAATTGPVATIPPIATETPAATATPIPTATSAPKATPQPTATPPPTVAPTETPLPEGAYANAAANLREGPGTEYAVVGGLDANSSIEVVGRNAAGDWYQLDGGQWIAAFLVTQAPGDLPVTAVQASPQENDNAGSRTVDAYEIVTDCPCNEGDTLNCDSFSSRSDVETCFEKCLKETGRDVHGLDTNNDRNVCERERY